MTINEERQVSTAIAKSFEMNDISFADFESFRRKLIENISTLIDTDFEKLLWILYRVDVSEEKARALLALNPAQPATVLADLLIERELQKYHSRKTFRDISNDNRDSDLKL
ncbi:MAG TPA: hypothetical protein DCQ93_01470 [Bacteroidetes bacterium]|nr:hypothetical protein [Bacteroidota bacterium]